MSDWQHVEPDWVEPYYARCGATMGALVCGCIIPTPDAASPCAVCGFGSGRDHISTYPFHGAHQPTLCRCGHPIECVPPEGR